MYLVNDTLHDQLTSSNPTVTFAIGSSVSSPDTININFPYSAFDLTAKAPLTANGTSRYFPLRRAANETQYLLGRTFLQQAYLTVDYDRNTFSVAQAVFPDANVPQKLVTIFPPGHGGTGALKTSAIVGIAVGVVILVVIAAIAIFRRYRRRRAAQKATTLAGDISGPSKEAARQEVDGKDSAIKQGSPRHPSELTSSHFGKGPHPSELNSQGQNTSELGTYPWPSELSGRGRLPPELAGNDRHEDRGELGGTWRPLELQGAGQVRHELP